MCTITLGPFSISLLHSLLQNRVCIKVVDVFNLSIFSAVLRVYFIKHRMKMTQQHFSLSFRFRYAVVVVNITSV